MSESLPSPTSPDYDACYRERWWALVRACLDVVRRTGLFLAALAGTWVMLASVAQGGPAALLWSLPLWLVGVLVLLVTAFAERASAAQAATQEAHEAPVQRAG